MAELPPGPLCGQYHVAWVSAIGTEYLVASAILDLQYEPPDDLTEDDERSYTFGRIGRHNVVMASLPANRVGVEEARALATDMRRSFRGLRFGLMVGIAGGAPSKENDVRLGDIVVSLPNDKKRLGGVVHYGFGASIQEQGFIRRGQLNAPPEVLLNAVRQLDNVYGQKGQHIDRLVSDLIEKKKPYLDRYARPNDAPDFLFNPNFLHPEGAPPCKELCHFHEEEIIPRLTRDIDKQVVIHEGVIGSASNLMRDAHLRDKIAKEDGALCFEMESAGLMNNTLGWLVIRGICDYCDTHKNDDWQPYAAAVAAMYAKELLGTIRPIKYIVTASVPDGVSASVEIALRKKGVLAYLSYENMNTKRDFAIPEDSFNLDWIWKTSFTKWLSEQQSIFWINGKPGSGKSTLVAHLAINNGTKQRLEHNGTSWSLLHFFYDYRAGAGLANSVHGMLRMLLYQLADHDESIRHYLAISITEGLLDLDSYQSLWDTTCGALTLPGPNYCVFVDGLDEYQGDKTTGDKRNILELLGRCKLLRERTGIKLCVASRPDVPVLAVFDNVESISMQDFNEASMRMYAKAQTLEKLESDLAIEKRFSAEIVDDLVRKAEGVLLWFRLVVDEWLVKYDASYTDDELHDFVDNVPVNLDGIYERAVSLIHPSHRPEAALLLFIIARLTDLAEHHREVTTTLDHLFGVYDFLAQQIGNQTTLHKFDDLDQFQGRVRWLLRGMIEFSQYDSDEKKDNLYLGFTRINVRYIHKTFEVYMMSQSSWIDQNLPPAFNQLYPDHFWSRFTTMLLEQASNDKVIATDFVRETLREARSIMKLLTNVHGRRTSDEFGNSYLAPKKLLTNLTRVVQNRRSHALGLVKELILDSNEPEPESDKGFWASIGKKFSDKVLTVSQPYSVPAAWKSRRIIFRTTLVLLLGCTSNDSSDDIENSLIARAFATEISLLPAGLWFAVQPEKGIAMIEMLINRTSEIQPILDLLMLLMAEKEAYFSWRLVNIPLSKAHQNMLVFAILTKDRAGGFNTITSYDIISTLRRQNMTTSPQDLCYLLCSPHICTDKLANYIDVLLSRLLPEPSTIEEYPHHDLCEWHREKSGLLLHWAQLRCQPLPDEKCDHETNQSENLARAAVRRRDTFEKILKAVVRYDIDINRFCYPGGTVLHALFDPKIQNKPHFSTRDLRAKFDVLREYGIDPTLRGTSGNALQAARAFKRDNDICRRIKKKDNPNTQEDIDAVIEALAHYHKNGCWPSSVDESSASSSEPEEKPAPEDGAINKSNTEIEPYFDSRSEDDSVEDGKQRPSI